MKNYKQEQDNLAFIEFVLHQRFSFTVEPDAQLDPEDVADFEAILPKMLANKEKKRLKAEFRDLKLQKQRVETDLICALDVARRLFDKSPLGRKAYLVSSDRAFMFLQRSPEWGNRPRIYLQTGAIAQLAEFVCGLRLDADQIVRAVFNPVHIAAAEQLQEPLLELARVGVDLRKASLAKLEWDMRMGLRSAVEDFKRDSSDDVPAAEKVAGGLALGAKAEALGYALDPDMAELVRDFEKVKKELEEERAKRSEAEKVAQRLVDGAAGLSRKGQRRVKSILHDLGGWKPTDDDVN